MTIWQTRIIFMDF